MIYNNSIGRTTRRETQYPKRYIIIFAHYAILTGCAVHSSRSSSIIGIIILYIIICIHGNQFLRGSEENLSSRRIILYRRTMRIHYIISLLLGIDLKTKIFYINYAFQLPNVQDVPSHSSRDNQILCVFFLMSVPWSKVILSTTVFGKCISVLL